MTRTTTEELCFEAEDDTHLYASDDDGDTRILPKAEISYTLNRATGDLRAIVPVGIWLNSKGKDSLATRKAKRPAPVTRKCLNCHHTFKADPAIHVCSPCKSTSYWRMGSDFSLAA